ncbi:hypothetical protein BJV74DRAFT_114771 [Russula compacta]|nr:hypothetical protein BJV74DRAFT_114771 [Russula compacta]
MGTGRLGRLLMTTSKFKSAAESKGKAPAASLESAEGNRLPILGIDTHSLTTVGSRQSYGTIGGPSLPKSHSPETYRSGHLLFDVPEEVDANDEELEVLLEEEGFYLGSYSHLVRIYTIVPVTSFLVWIILALAPLFLWPNRSPSIPHPPYFLTPLPELLLSTSLFSLSHLLNPYLFMIARVLIPHPTATCVLGTALHVILRNALRTAAFPMLSLAVPSGAATFRAPAFWRVWWLALGWSLAEVAAGIAQGYETLTFYRDVLVSESTARELVASAMGLTVPTWPQPKSSGSDSDSPPRTADEQLRESLSRGEDGGGGSGAEVVASPVRGRRQQPSSYRERSSWGTTNDVVIQQLEVDKDFDELVAVKAREELEELYGFPAIRVPVFVSCLLRIASILLSLGIVLLLSAGYLTSPIALPPTAEDALTMAIPPSWSNNMFWVTFLGVCGINCALSLLHTPVFLPRVGVHVVAYLGFLVGLGMLFTGLGMWDALS